MSASLAAPEELFQERLGRLKTAIALGTPDRVPLSLVMDAFAAKTMGVKMSDFVSDVDVAGQAMLSTMEVLGDVDSIQQAVSTPSMGSLLWLAPMKLPGRDLPDNSLWQMDEQVRLTPADYDRIADEGWEAWRKEYMDKHLGGAEAACEAVMEAGPRWTKEYAKRGYVVFAPVGVDHPFEHLCGGRSVKEFMLDLYRIPDRVQAAMDVMMSNKRQRARDLVQAAGPVGCWVGGWRTAPEFLSRKLWDRFVWPYMKELVEIVSDEGGIPVLHYDANWDRELERLKELPRAKCVLALDSKTDIFRAKEVLGGHICLLGDVPPALLTLGTPDQVHAYCRRLITEVGPSGFILAQGCAIPPDAKLENVRAMVDSVH